MAGIYPQDYKALPQILSSLAMSSAAALVGGWVSFSNVALPKMIAETESSLAIRYSSAVLERDI